MPTYVVEPAVFRGPGRAASGRLDGGGEDRRRAGNEARDRVATRPVWPRFEIGAASFVAAAVLVFAAPAVAQTFPIRFHARPDGQANEWLSQQLAVANAHFAPAGVQFIVAERYWLDHDHIAVTSHTELAAMVSADADASAGIDVFYVDFFTDEEDPTSRGVRELGRTLRPGRRVDLSPFVLVTPDSSPVLAHELGHFFGLDHTPRHTSLMSEQDVVLVPFSAREIATIRASAARARASCWPPVVFDPFAPWPAPTTGFREVQKPGVRRQPKVG